MAYDFNYGDGQDQHTIPEQQSKDNKALIVILIGVCIMVLPRL
jgi:hypothetical protein